MALHQPLRIARAVQRHQRPVPRALCAWIARAISSLPVPDSPEMHTLHPRRHLLGSSPAPPQLRRLCPTSPCPPAPPARRRCSAPPQPQPTHHPLQRRRQLASPPARSSHCTPASAGAPPPAPPPPAPPPGSPAPAPAAAAPAPTPSRRLQVHHRQRRPPVRTAPPCSSSCSDPTKCGSSHDRGDAPDHHGKIQRFVKHQEIHAESVPPDTLVRGCGAVP